MGRGQVLGFVNFTLIHLHIKVKVTAKQGAVCPGTLRRHSGLISRPPQGDITFFWWRLLPPIYKQHICKRKRARCALY